MCAITRSTWGSKRGVFSAHILLSKLDLTRPVPDFSWWTMMMNVLPCSLSTSCDLPLGPTKYIKLHFPVAVFSVALFPLYGWKLLSCNGFFPRNIPDFSFENSINLDIHLAKGPIVFTAVIKLVFYQFWELYKSQLYPSLVYFSNPTREGT